MNAICINNDYYQASLVLNKSYHILEEEEGYIRIIDEDNMDYLYPMSLFKLEEENKDVRKTN